MPLLNRPNPASGIPVHLQLMAQVRHAVDTGALRPGESLPGVHPLAEMLVINPRHVARAYQELARQGILEPATDASLVHVSRLRSPLASFVAAGPSGSSGIPQVDSGLSRIPHTERASQLARAQMDRLLRDLESAREVQERLFPQHCPPIAGLDYAGACRPAHSVGGDYYDFIPLSDRELVIAIGDVSGKGMPAALLMATLRASVHGRAAASLDLAAMMSDLNQLVFESSAANRFATFFYGRYDAATRVLRYVNAGHNPPVVFTAHGTELLEPCGPAIGMMPDCIYTERQITLNEGDMLVAFTDGIPEAMNASSEEWGDQHMLEVASSGRGLSARQLLDRIMSEADRFAGGAPQYDDMTLVTARVI